MRIRSRCLVGNVGGSVCPNRSEVPLGKKISFLTDKGQGIAAEASEKKRLDLELSDTNTRMNNMEVSVGNPDPH